MEGGRGRRYDANVNRPAWPPHLLPFLLLLLLLIRAGVDGDSLLVQGPDVLPHRRALRGAGGNLHRFFALVAESGLLLGDLFHGDLHVMTFPRQL